MSSRRKSRPVRRLDTDGSAELVPLQLDSISDAVFEDQPYQDSSPSPEGSPQNPDAVNADARLSSQSEEDEHSTDGRNSPDDISIESRNPPAGVYIVQPQSVSDDEGQEGKSVSKTLSRRPDYDEEKSEIGSKKRQLDDMKEDLVKDGLDLTIKRRKTEDDMAHQGHGGSAEDTRLSLPTQDYQANLQRFENFIQLLASKRRSVADENRDALAKELSSRGGFPAHSPGTYKSRDNTENDADTTAQDGGYPSAPSWDHDSEKAVEQNWNDKNNYSGVKSLPQGVSYSSSLTPAVAAAMMATLVSNSDANVTESAASSAVLQNLFKQRESLLAQQMISKKSTSNNQYSTSPDAMDTITAGTVSSGVGSIKKGTLDPTNFDEEVFDKYISRFSAKNSCMQASCPHINREHYHCTDSDCNFQRFTNKSDVIRHYNMHKKRDNSLAHGFMRFSPTDNCQNQFGPCHLNGKSTHYHCLHSNCTRVYTSTSDVMTHENFHKKNQHFVTNGFQRYRATEDCGAEFCPFRSQRTTHFHCTRKDCNFTFKNKCDMEKHKSYHQRDDAYTRQGFKKFYKNEPCQFPSCAWNRTANHFHCLRKNCDFSFTSTGQMVSHKRKHDRQDMLSAERGTATSPVPLSGSCSDARKRNLSNFFGYSRSMVASTPLIRAAYPPPQFSPLYFDSRSPGSSVFRNFSYLNPYLSSSFSKRSSTSLGLEPNTSVPASLDSVSFHEAARKVLAAIPSSVAAAAMPRALPKFNENDSSSLPAYRLNSTSPTILARVSETAMQKREEDAAEVSLQQEERPPPPYLEGPLNMSNRSSTAYEHDNNLNDDELESHQKTDRSTATSPDERDDENDEGLVLNLSKKSVKVENAEEMQANPVAKENTLSSPLVLKYFRGLSPNECTVSHCAFVDRYHFHCVVKDCFAAFTDKALVFNHTLFHENLERMGVSQISAKFFPSFFPSVSRSVSSQESTTSPPPGYIALSSTSNKAKDIYREKENGCRDVTRSPPRDLPMESEDQRTVPSNAATSSLEAKDTHTLNPMPQNHRSAILEYYTRLLSKSKMANYFQVQQSCPPSTSVRTPYMTLEAPAEMSSLVRSQSCTLPENQDQNESFKNANSSPLDGYIHVRAGSACIRADCKYVLQSHWHCTLNRCRYVCKSLAKAQSHRQAHDSLEAYARAAKEYFKSYTVKKNCPDPTCEFRHRGHYHCLKPGCQFVTIGTSKLPWHMKKHEKIAKREASGFKYFTKKDQCGRPDCKYNGQFSHYHCIRAGCAFAFQYKHQMSTHVRKHLRRMLGRSYSGADVPTDVSNLDHSNVDSGDDSLPLIVDEADEIEQRPGISIETTQPMQISTPVMQSGTGFTSQQISMLQQFSRGFKPLMSNQNVGSNNNNLQSDVVNEERPLNGYEGNGDIDGNSSSEEILDLRANSNVQDLDSSSNSSSNNNGVNDESFAPSDGEKNQENAHLMEQENKTLLSFPAQKRRDDAGSLFSKFRLNNDVMSGFKRFLITEDCGDPQCSYSLRVSHYHCLHEDCHYRFTGRTHMFKHRQHHERVAGLIRNDFKRFKATQNCHNSDCTYNGNSTHFHCLRCPFKCTDSAKVGAHRRHHLKADTLEQSGFERFKGKEDCGRETCKYRHRNTSHFHCLQPGCSYAVVGLSGIEQHSKKHERYQAHQHSDQVNFSIIAKPLINSAESPLTTSLFAASVPGAQSFTYSVPFTALSSAPSVTTRTSDASSPIMDDQPSISPIVTSLPTQIGNKTDVGFINLANMTLNREITGNTVSAGFKI